MAGEDTSGRFAWHELMTTDPEAATTFYTNVIGWTTAPYEGTGQPYTMWMAGDTPIGGVMDLPEQAREAGAPPNWMAYVSVEDAGASVDRARALGGNIVVPPFEVPTVGTLAVISDPQGAVIALLQPDTPMPAVPPSRGRFSWAELLTSDPEGAFSFYSELFGWEKAMEMDMGPGGTYHIFGMKGEQWGGIYKPPEAPGPSAWLYYAMVDSADVAAERAAAGGGKLVHGPMEVPGGDRIAVCMDPQGAMFAVHSKAAG